MTKRRLRNQSTAELRPDDITPVTYTQSHIHTHSSTHNTSIWLMTALALSDSVFLCAVHKLPYLLTYSHTQTQQWKPRHQRLSFMSKCTATAVTQCSGHNNAMINADETEYVNRMKKHKASMRVAMSDGQLITTECLSCYYYYYYY